MGAAASTYRDLGASLIGHHGANWRPSHSLLLSLVPCLSPRCCDGISGLGFGIAALWINVSGKVHDPIAKGDIFRCGHEQGRLFIRAIHHRCKSNPQTTAECRLGQKRTLSLLFLYYLGPKLLDVVTFVGQVPRTRRLCLLNFRQCLPYSSVHIALNYTLYSNWRCFLPKTKLINAYGVLCDIVTLS
ncbi:hypothetical protein Ddc_06196 [Ditylenchus destructor]|nr:hypothetical protein Ddc_06196 [Ditylenchus destructor]